MALLVREGSSGIWLSMIDWTLDGSNCQVGGWVQ